MTAAAKKPIIRVALAESDPLRLIGFRSLFDSERDFELTAASVSQLASNVDVDIVLLGNRPGLNLFDVMASLKAIRPDLKADRNYRQRH